MNKNTIVVNLFAGPGSGKSTSMADIFAKLKRRGIDCEMAGEYAKEKVWEGTENVLDDQFYISAKQYHRIRILKGKVDVIITDSPILLGLYYGENEPIEFHSILIQKFKEFNNLNILLERNTEYNPNGRLQTENEAKEIDKALHKIVNIHCDEIGKTTPESENIDMIIDLIIGKLDQDKNGK